MPDADVVAGLQAQLLEYRSSLVDPVTGLPALPLVMGEIARWLEQSPVVVILVRIEQEQSLEGVIGWEQYDQLLRTLADSLRDAVASSSGAPSLLCQPWVRGEEFLVFTADRRAAARVCEVVQEAWVAGSTGGERRAPLRFGEAVAVRHGALRLERCVFAAVEEARRDLERHRQSLDEGRLVELRGVLRERRVRTLFQPIFRVPQRTVVGQEALSRGPEGSYLEGADTLFGFADRAGLLGELERLCVERALNAAHRLPLGSTVFVNLSVTGLEHLERDAGGLAHVVRQSGWSPREIVLELTERNYADNPDLLRQRVGALRGQGFRIAIDDMGTGYASLNVVADLRPDYIKLDRVLVHGLAGAAIKRNLVTALTGFARTAQTLVIAEGVERREDEQALLELGVSLVQGFLLGCPRAV